MINWFPAKNDSHQTFLPPVYGTPCRSTPWNRLWMIFWMQCYLPRCHFLLSNGELRGQKCLLEYVFELVKLSNLSSLVLTTLNYTVKQSPISTRYSRQPMRWMMALLVDGWAGWPPCEFLYHSLILAKFFYQITNKVLSRSNPNPFHTVQVEKI